MRKALIVGIDNYPKAPLGGCVHDATQMENELRKHGDGSPNFDTKLLIDPPKKITKPLLKEAIVTLFSGDSDVALLYFSGHGTITSTGGYIVTPDYASYDEGISMDEVLSLANKSKSRDKIVILDCCHSGSFGSPFLTGQNASLLGDGLTVLTACRDCESAVEQEGQGVFTSLLIDALQGGASDLRGNITPGSLYSYVDEALGAWEQRPIFKTNISKFVAVKKTEPPIQLEILRRIVEYFPSPDQEHHLEPSYEETEPGSDPAKVKVFKDLQKYVACRLVRPVGEEHMYWAAIHSKSCRLTALGYQYWRLVSDNKI